MAAIKQKTGSTNELTDVQLLSALVQLYERQEEDEKTGGYTSHKNGRGFNAIDSTILSSIAKQWLKSGSISDKQLYVVKNRLKKYSEQISTMYLDKGSDKLIVVNDLIFSEQAPAKALITERRAVINEDKAVLSFPYDVSLIFKVKCITGRKYNATEKTWTIPLSAEGMHFINSQDFHIIGELPVVKKADKSKRKLPKTDRTLRPYQKEGVLRMAFDMDMKALLADEPGLGKTCQSIMACVSRKDDAFPVLVICPSSLKYNWERECKMWMPKCTTRILSGRTSHGINIRKNEFTIINYDVVHGWKEKLANTQYKTIILDECQRIKNRSAKRTKAITFIKKTVPNVLCLSGTPAENKPSELYSAISLIKPALFPNLIKFSKRYCGAEYNGYGWTYNGATHTQELHQILTETIMVRRKKEDVLTELPTKQRIVIPVDVDLREYRAIASKALSYMQEIKGMKPKAKAQAGAEALVNMEKCKQAAVLAKMPSVLEWIEDYLDSGKKLVVFATHSFVLDMIENEYDKGTVVRVDGSTPNKKRQENVDAFQNDDNVRLFIGNTKAAGVGLTLTAASDTLTLEFGWTPGEHDQAEDRVHRIGQDSDSVNAYYIVSCGTIEEDLAELLDVKRNNLSRVLDGIDCSEEEALVWQLYKRLEERNE